MSTVVTSECAEAAAEASMSSFRCENVDSQRCHVFPITDLASTSTLSSESKEVIHFILLFVPLAYYVVFSIDRIKIL